jgi:hypothetical protein
MTRWKIVPSYRDPCSWAPVAGLRQGLEPVARPMKFSTVLGAVSGNRRTRIGPLEVSRVA